MNELQQRATAGEELPVDYASIEQTLSQLWHVDTADEGTVTRAALWNVVAHAATGQHHAETSEILAKASATVPQRSIVIRADPASPPELAAWISANCHALPEGKQVCSEEIAIHAGGERVARVPPLVNALLIPDMPVAFWWHGDLPHENPDYVTALLEPADRLIVDSVHFNDRDDLALVESIARRTSTAAADLNWIRSEEWRVATASVFDPQAVRARLSTLRSIRVVVDTTDRAWFGQWVAPLFYASWLIAQAGADPARVTTEFELRPAERHGLARVEIGLEGSTATIARDAGRCVLTTNIDGHLEVPDGVTRSGARSLEDLIIRELKQPNSDRVFRKVLPVALSISDRVKR